uniref:Diacylglycerol kinase n=1 Tax=Sinocyclocheilus grahami TaxID=75366 RepID=A0A672SRP2_SINGR
MGAVRMRVQTADKNITIIHTTPVHQFTSGEEKIEKQNQTLTILKEGKLMKQTNFQRWKRRYFKLRGRTLYYAQTAKSIIFDEVDLTDASVAESSTKNFNNSFTVITPCRRLVLCAENRKEMEEWIAALKSVQNREHFESTQLSMDHFSGMHNWYACSHARPTYCNVCREALSGVTSHGLSCEVCKFKAHKRCAVRATNNCKWTTLASIGKDILEDEDGISMPHQWLEGNLPVSAKCTVCDKTCGSVLRLQDWRCLWCKAMVHAGCKDQLSPKCPLGQCKVSVIPPTALNSIDSDGFWKATCPPTCTSPLLVFVNSKSGDNQGVKFLRRFKQLLNPAQVFDLMNGGPHLGLRLFQKFDTFRILVCGGDGSVGWVLSEIDALTLHKQLCCLSYRFMSRRVQHILTYEDSVAAHLSKILTSDQHSVVISSAKVLCETVKDFVAKVGRAYEKNTENLEESEAMAKKCGVLKEKLDSLLKTLNDEAQASSVMSAPPPTIAEEQVDGEEQLMLRANSLKKAIRQIIEHTEKAVDEQNAQTEEGLPSLPAEEEEEDDGSETLSLLMGRCFSVCFRDLYTEKCVMNNYFGIGLDAKISLDFNNKRDEHPEKCRSRTKNMMWYGVLGTKELLHRTYKGSCVCVCCDGRPIPLPSLQGIAVLNIPSYAGGTNFWGGTKEDDTFMAPSFDDKILEVVAVFGSMQMAVSRVINLQHHRIAQCRTVKITILGDEGVPVQVDGEAWIQPPGYIRILHKNRTQTLTRDRAFENTLKSWEDKQRGEIPRLVSQHASQPEIVSEDETTQISLFGQAAGALIHSIREAAQSHHTIEQELAHAVNASSKAMDLVYANSKSSGVSRCLLWFVFHDHVSVFVSLQQLDPPQRDQLIGALSSVTQQLRRLTDISWLSQLIDPADDEVRDIQLFLGCFGECVPV